jgi:Protein of unknown function (DUF3225)
MIINDSPMRAEVETVFARYETALVGNDVDVLDALFWQDARTIRYGIAENLYGAAEILAFRQGRSPTDLARDLSRTVITTFGTDFATASTLFTLRPFGWLTAGYRGTTVRRHEKGPAAFVLGRRNRPDGVRPRLF